VGLEFDHRGLLPDGIHPCDEGLFCDALVDPFPGDPTRAAIKDGFFKLREKAVGHGISATQWVDGSFVEKRAAPKDVDVVTFADGELVNGLPDEAKSFISDILAGRERAKPVYRTHSFFVAAVADTHPAYRAFHLNCLRIRKWFGHTRALPNPIGGEIPGLSKGILTMGLGDPDLRPSVPEG
jgi:hypothetical protein